jgi:plastocyanin
MNRASNAKPMNLAIRRWSSVPAAWAVTAVMAVMAGLGTGGSAGAAPAAMVDTGRITIKDFMFSPMTITVKAGGIVTWANSDDEPHTVVSDAGLFRSGAVDTGETFTFRFDRPGTYHFTCSIHPRMVGTIIVE